MKGYNLLLLFMVEFLFHLSDLLVELSEDFVPLNVEAVHFLQVGLLDFLHLSLMSIPDLLHFPLFSHFPQRLHFPLTALRLHILSTVLALLLSHYQFVT